MDRNISEQELFILQKMIEGDERAFKYFFDSYYDDLCNFVNGYLRDETLSEDIVQGIFVYLWEKKDTLPLNCSIKAYLYTASKNKALNHLRNLKTKNKVITDLLKQSEEYSSENADLFIEFEDLKKLVINAISALPAQCKIIYQLSRDKGLSNKEIADHLGISVKTVENQITIAIRKIKDFMQPYHEQIFVLYLFLNFF